MKIAVDAMGGDNAPEATIKGSIEALNDFKDLHIIITGPKELLNKKLSKYSYDKNRLEIVNASEIITNNEHPVMAIRKKKDSSLYKALSLVKKKEAEAVISAGSTGAFMAGSLFIVGRIKGVDRPAIAPIIPGKNNPFMLIDAGANAECKPHNLLQFALMGSVYFENILNVKNPSVGLVNIGEEEEKGNTLTKSAFKLLKDSDLNFIGNVEPREVPMGDSNILVCDGFVGNTILKMYEGVAGVIFSTLKDEIMNSTRTKIGGALLKPAFKNFKKKFDYKEYGGAVFLGVKGICVKAHGSSDYLAIKNAIKQSIKYYESDVVNKIKNKMEQIDNNIDSEK